MTGRTFDGQQAAEMGLVNASVPLAQLRGEVEALARELLGKNPVVLRAAKLGYKHCAAMSWDQAEDYLYAKLEQSQFLDAERGREQGLEQFLDEKRIKPGLQTYERPDRPERGAAAQLPHRPPRSRAAPPSLCGGRADRTDASRLHRAVGAARRRTGSRTRISPGARSSRRSR